MSTFGSKDLIPARVFVAYNNEPPITLPKPLPATKPIVTKPVVEPKPVASVKTAPKVLTVKHSVKIAAAPKPKHYTGAHSTANASVEDPGVVTIVYNDPSGVLSADISLQHE